MVTVLAVVAEGVVKVEAMPVEMAQVVVPVEMEETSVEDGTFLRRDLLEDPLEDPLEERARLYFPKTPTHRKRLGLLPVVVCSTPTLSIPTLSPRRSIRSTRSIHSLPSTLSM